MKPKTIIWLVAVLIFALFLFINRHPAKLDYLFGRTEMPLLVWILFSALFGFVLGWFGHLTYRRGRERARRERHPTDL